MTRFRLTGTPRHLAFVVSLSLHAVVVVCAASLPKSVSPAGSARDESAVASARAAAQSSADATEGDITVVGHAGSRRGPARSTDSRDSSPPRRVLVARGESDAVLASQADEDFESGAPKGWRMNQRGAAS
jgi:hypothetical protein